MHCKHKNSVLIERVTNWDGVLYPLYNISSTDLLPFAEDYVILAANYGYNAKITDDGIGGYKILINEDKMISV